MPNNLIWERKSLPDELGEDPETRKLYEKAIEEGVETDKNIRVMIIGCFGQGKTTLVQRLQGNSVDHVGRTDGIVIYRCISVDKSWKKNDEFDADDVPQRAATYAASASYKESGALLSSPNSPNILVAEDQQTDEQAEDCKSTNSSLTISYKRKAGEPSIMDKRDYQEFRKNLKRMKTSQNEHFKTKHISLWDFGGQYIYYATHQLFHSANAVYLLVFNLSLPLDAVIHDQDYPGKSNSKTMKDYIIFWMHSIHSFVGRPDGKEPVVILVSTHMDLLENDKQAELYFKSVQNLFEFSPVRFHIHPKYFALSKADDSQEQVDELKATILEVGDRPEFKRSIPIKWAYLERELINHTKKHIISFQELLVIDQQMKFPIKDEERLKLFLKYHHAKGTYCYFDEAEMTNLVVVNPKFVIDAFRCIIKPKTFCTQDVQDLDHLWKKLSDEAILKPELFRKVWRDKDSEKFSEHEDGLVLMLKKHRIIAEVMKYEDKKDQVSLKPQGFFIVPSLLKRPDDGKIEDFLKGKPRSTVSVVYSFHCIGIVGTIFQRMLAAAIGTWPVLTYIDCLMVFENGGVFELDLNHAGLFKLEDGNIELCVVNLCPEYSVASGMGDYFRRFVEVVIHYEFSKLNTSFDVYIRCHHEDHMNKGSRTMLLLKKIQEHTGDIFRCPDSVSHSLKKKDVQNDWFQQKHTINQFPAFKLTNKEYSELACAIGYEWEMLGIRLGVDHIKIQHLNMDRQETAMKIYLMLLEWDNKYAEKATFDVLVKELEKMPKTSVNWEKVFNIKDNFYKLR